MKTRSQYESPEGNDACAIETNVLADGSFPAIDFDTCFIVTDRNVYTIELSDRPETIFMTYVRQSMWPSCKYFCDIFNLSLPQCMEYAGDELLRQHKVAQALMTYNVAHIPPIKTALKLATYGESNALMHLCAMALKCVHLLRSTKLTGPHTRELLADAKLRNIPAPAGVAVTPKKRNSAANNLNTGIHCSDFSYEHDEVGMDVQMSFSSQFHLSNLMLLTLCERTIADKNYVPLWNFLHHNSRYHTNLASTVLAQSGLYSTAIHLAKIRGSLDVFMALVKAIDQEFGEL